MTSHGTTGVATNYSAKEEDLHHEVVCDNCHRLELFQRLTDEAIAKIDQMIFERDILQGMITYKDALQIGLKEAMELYDWRYNQLRKSAPEKFTEGPEGYWAGFYS